MTRLEHPIGSGASIHRRRQGELEGDLGRKARRPIGIAGSVGEGVGVDHRAGRGQIKRDIAIEALDAPQKLPGQCDRRDIAGT